MKKDFIIIGAGLAGTLMAIRLAERGHEVDLYERRPDLRKADLSAGRSINLALSNRGLAALDMVGLREEALKLAIPMYGRRIHPQGSYNTTLYRYSGRENEWINSISRPGLNALLIEKAESHPNIKIHFSCPIQKVNSREGWMLVPEQGKLLKIDITDKIVIGSDGAGSVLRREIQKRSNELRFNFSQQFLDTGYKELCLPAGPNGEFQIDKNALHIWPRDNFMMIALPNLDGSFTVTLFMRFEGENGFDSITEHDHIHELFDKNFTDVKYLFPDLSKEYNENPTSSLGTIRCYPWQLDGQYLLLGDAAHAIVPFYGQGMNCAFEDCIILDQSITKYEGNWEAIFRDYQETRKIDADAIASLAEDNFYEMRDATADPTFNKKRQIELTLEQQFPEYYSKYSLVTFREDLPYHLAMKKGRKQDEILMDIARDVEDVNSIDLKEVLQRLAIEY